MNHLFALSALASFTYVFLRAMQQLNVVHNQYWWVMPTSIAMGLCDVWIILLIVRSETIWIGVTNGVGAGIGAVLAMYLHNRFRTSK